MEFWGMCSIHIILKGQIIPIKNNKFKNTQIIPKIYLKTWKRSKN